ncbi:response regulator [Ottowia thiooxydans]|uniref:DNA-binding NarL/FixJ family response regulator n=1 Tax=Ottowia thiooxydans TaxID=219182 RepID=A0ABV2Q9X3_9BURK
MQHAASPIRVFLADDSALSRSRLTAVLLAQGMGIAGQAETPEAAVAGILATRPDVAVLDVQFEKGSGMKVLEAVRKATRDIPFIVMSNHAEPAYRARYLAAGAAWFLDKHTEFYQLASKVQTVAMRSPSRTFHQPVSSS